MSDHRLMPVEPDVGMVGAGARVLRRLPGAEKLATQVYRSMCAAAPDVQGEPEYGSTPQYINDAIDNLAHANYELSYAGYQERTRDVELIRAYVARAPQPAERQSVLNLSEAARSLGIAQEKGDQGAIDYWGAMVSRFEREVIQPAEQQSSAGDSLMSVPDEVFAAEFAAWWEHHGQFCRAGGGDYERSFAFEAWRHLYPRLMSLQKLVAEQQPDVAQLVEHRFPSSYPVSGNVYFRDSTGEWVLEITASINGTRCTARHVQPAGTRPEDVVGLPALYASAPDITQLVEALERSVAGFDALSGMASLDAGARNYARQKALELNANLAAHRSRGEV